MCRFNTCTFVLYSQSFNDIDSHSIISTEVASSGTFYKDASLTGLTYGQSGVPGGWTIEDYIEAA